MQKPLSVFVINTSLVLLVVTVVTVGAIDFIGGVVYFILFALTVIPYQLSM
jgi:hypothetical protein